MQSTAIDLENTQLTALMIMTQYPKASPSWDVIPPSILKLLDDMIDSPTDKKKKKQI